MQRAHVCAALGTFFMLAASSTYAGQVELSVENRIGGDSNVFRTEDQPNKKIDDGTWEFLPRLGVRDDGTDVSYGFDYAPTYRNFFRTKGIDGVDHNAQGRIGWSVSPTDRIDATGSYYNGRQLRFTDFQAGVLPTLDINDRARVKQSDATVNYRHLFTHQLSVSLLGDFDDFDAGTDLGSQTDSRAYTGRISAQYAWSNLTEFGLSASARRRENRAVDPDVFNPPPTPKTSIPNASSKTDVFDILASVSRQLTPTMKASLQAGPSVIRQQQYPGGAIGITHEDSRDVTLFASASLEKQWQTSNVSASYVRSEQRSGSTSSGSSIADQIQLNAERRINDDLVARFQGGWSQLDQIVSDGNSDDRFKLTVLQSIGTLEYTLTKHILLIGQYAYTWQENESNRNGFNSHIDVHVGFVSLRYTFEPLSY